MVNIWLKLSEYYNKYYNHIQWNYRIFDYLNHEYINKNLTLRYDILKNSFILKDNEEQSDLICGLTRFDYKSQKYWFEKLFKKRKKFHQYFIMSMLKYYDCTESDIIDSINKFNIDIYYNNYYVFRYAINNRLFNLLEICIQKINNCRNFSIIKLVFEKISYDVELIDFILQNITFCINIKRLINICILYNKNPSIYKYLLKKFQYNENEYILNLTLKYINNNNTKKYKKKRMINLMLINNINIPVQKLCCFYNLIINDKESIFSLQSVINFLDKYNYFKELDLKSIFNILINTTKKIKLTNLIINNEEIYEKIDKFNINKKTKFNKRELNKIFKICIDIIKKEKYTILNKIIECFIIKVIKTFFINDYNFIYMCMENYDECILKYFNIAIQQEFKQNNFKVVNRQNFFIKF